MYVLWKRGKTGRKTGHKIKQLIRKSKAGKLRLLQGGLWIPPSHVPLHDHPTPINKLCTRLYTRVLTLTPWKETNLYCYVCVFRKALICCARVWMWCTFFALPSVYQSITDFIFVSSGSLQPFLPRSECHVRLHSELCRVLLGGRHQQRGHGVHPIPQRSCQRFWRSALCSCSVRL